MREVEREGDEEGEEEEEEEEKWTWPITHLFLFLPPPYLFLLFGRLGQWWWRLQALQHCRIGRQLLQLTHHKGHAGPREGVLSRI